MSNSVGGRVKMSKRSEGQEVGLVGLGVVWILNTFLKAGQLGEVKYFIRKVTLVIYNVVG
jgi:hypothetical protein